jgi:hypothetical protein
VSVDFALPPLEQAGQLKWSNTTPVQPILRFTDLGSMASVQGWLVTTAILLGVGASLVANGFFHLATRMTADTQVTTGMGESEMDFKERESSSWHTAEIVLLLFLILIARARTSDSPAIPVKRRSANVSETAVAISLGRADQAPAE